MEEDHETGKEFSSLLEINSKSINFPCEKILYFNETDNNFNNELKEIFEKMTFESESTGIKFFKSVELLYLFIRRHRNKTEEIIKEFSTFISKKKINIKLLVKCINTINKLIIEKNQLINFYDLIIPNLIEIIDKIKNENIKTIEKITDCIEKIINRIYCPNVQELEKRTDLFFKNIFDDKININDNSNNLYALVKCIIIQIKYYPTFSFYKIISKNTFNLFINLLKYYKHNKNEIRIIISELVGVFLNSIKNRDNEIKHYYSRLFYKQISEEYITNLKLNANVPNDYNILAGFILVSKKIFLFDPELYKKNYKKFMDDLFKCENSIKKEIKIEFIKNIPDLYCINKTIFNEKYMKLFCCYANTLLNIKTKKEIRNQLLLTLGQLSLVLNKNSFQVIIDPLISFLKIILNKANNNNNIDDEIFKCLADLLNNKENYYTKIILENLNIYSILPHLFCSSLSLYKIEFLLSLMKCYENSSKENIFTTIISLNAISIIICDEEMKLDYVTKYLSNNNINIDNDKIKKILQVIKKKIKYNKQHTNKINNTKEDIYFSYNTKFINNFQIITNSLTFLFYIVNDLFYKDMFIFFGEKLINLLYYVPNKIFKKIIDLILCKFITIYEDDINLSQFILFKLITSLKNSNKIRKGKIKEYILNTIIQKDVIIDIILKNKYSFLSEIPSILISEEENVKKKYIELIGLLLNKDSDNNYGFIFTQKIITTLIFELYHPYDLIREEDLSFLFSLFINSTKNFLNIQLIEKILKNIIYLNMYSFNLIITINLLNSLKSLFNSEIIYKNYNTTINDLCHILFVIYISLLKTGRIDDSNSGIIFEVLYYIIKINKIDINSKYNPKINFKSVTLDSENKINNLIIDNNINEQVSINNTKKKIIELINNINNQNIAELLLFNILKCENTIAISFIMKIFGLCGAMYPRKMEKSFNGEILMNHYFNDEKIEISMIENEYDIVVYNYKFKIFEELDLSNEEPSSIIATVFLIQILKQDFYHREFAKKIIPTLNTLIKSIKNQKSNLIKVFLLTIIEIIPQYDNIHQNELFECIYSIFINFREISITFIDSVIKLIFDYLNNEYLNILSKLLSVIFEKYIFYIQNYFSILINKFIYLLKKNKTNSSNCIKLLTSIIKYSHEEHIFINIYLTIIIEELIPEFLNEIDEILIIDYLNLFDAIIELRGASLYYRIIIVNLLNKIKQIVNNKSYNFDIQNNKIKKVTKKAIKNKFFNSTNSAVIMKIIEIIEKMDKNQRDYFFYFYPLIIKTFTKTGIIKVFQLQQKFRSLIKLYKNNLIYKDARNLENINCLYKNQWNMFFDEKPEIKEVNIEEKKDLKINFNIIYQILENFQYTNKENWYEIIKNLLSTSFENTLSNFLQCCNVTKDYYDKLSLIYNLNNNCYYDSIFNKLNENNKKIIVEKTTKAIIEMKEPNEIIMRLLNFSELLYRKNSTNFSFLDPKYYDELGKICYKCKTYAKSLCYIENIPFLNNSENFINLIELYEILDVQEAAIGLIKLANKKNLFNNSEFKDYKCYICIKDYDYALKLINEKLCHENEKETIYKLKKNKEICLNGLYDWEKLLLEDLNENSTSDIKINNEYTDLNSENDFFNDEHSDSLSSNSIFNDNYISQDYIDRNDLKRKIKRELMFIEASADLCKWDEVTKHLEKIRNKFNNILNTNFINEKKNNNNNINYNLQEIDKNANNNNILSTKNISDEKLSSFTLKNRFSSETSISINIEKYIPFNELIYKNENFYFLINNVDYLYNLNLFSSISFLSEKNYIVAEKYIDDARKVILDKIKPLLDESYSRSFDLFIKNQEISFMEDIIKYKKYHKGDKQYLKEIKKVWDKIFNLSIKEANNCKRFLKFFNLIFPVEEVYDKYIKLSKICRRFKYYTQSEKILNFIKKKINLNIANNKLLNEINIKIDLNHCKCLYEKGELNKALEKSKNLVKLLNDEQYSKIDYTLKSKVFGEYALYLQYNFINNYYKYNVSNTFNLNNNIKNKDLLNIGIKGKNLLNKENKLYISNKKDININYLNHLDIEENRNNQILFEKIKKINFFFSLACNYNKNNFKYWNNYTLFNYKYYKFIFNKNRIFHFNSSEIFLNKKKINQEIPFAMNTLKGVRTCLIFSENNTSESFENVLKLMDIFTNSAEENDEILLFISEIFNKVDTKSFAFFFPQLLRVIVSNNNKLLEIFIKFIIRMASNHQEHLIFLIITMKNLSKGREQSLYEQILFHLSKINKNIKELIEAYKFYSNKLIKSAILLHEEWKEVIQITSNLIIYNDYSEIINKLQEMHEKMRKPPESLYEIHFYQKYGSELKEAEIYLNKYISNKNVNYIKEAYEKYSLIYNQIINEYKNFNNISLEYICPKLCNNNKILNKICIQNHIYLEICDPLSVELNFIKSNQTKIYIKRIENNIFVYNSKNHPRKITYIGTDDKEYKFLLKGHENLILETTIMQLFIFINLKIKKEKKLQNKDLIIKTHIIMPFTSNIGLISFAKNYDSVFDLIMEYRKFINKPYNSEIKQIINLYPKYDSGNLLSKVEILKETINNNSGIELRNLIWQKSKNSESYVVRRTNYSRSLAVMSMVGYIIGLGDRHPNNLLMDRESGKIMHIDFGDCFEVAMKRNKYPEKIPFRLTKMFINALDVAGIEGTFRIVSEEIMELLRENKYSILFILNTFIYIPIFTFRFIISKIRKLKKEKIINQQNNINCLNDDINFSSISYISNKNNMSGKFSKIMNSYNNEITENDGRFKKKEEIEYSEEKNDDKKINFINEFKEDKKILEDEETLLIHNYEYRIKNKNKYNELNEISRSLLKRVINKLSGFDFEEDNKLEVKDQVDRLINQAESIENLAHLFLGWCPFM